MPLTSCTSATGLFHKNLLALRLPSLEPKTITIITKDGLAVGKGPRRYLRCILLAYG